MSMEVRLGTQARATMDVDLGLRDADLALDGLGERLTEALGRSMDDHFIYRLGDLQRLAVAGRADLVRARVECLLAGRPFGRIQVDVVCRPHELSDTDRLRLPGHLRFAAIEPPEIEMVSVARHVGEKLHAMLLEFGDRENTRVRDLADLVILREHGLIDPRRAADAVRQVFAERATALPRALPPFPTGWPERYERIAREQGIATATFAQAAALLASLWDEMFRPAKEDR
jgi:hypothetical protein